MIVKIILIINILNISLALPFLYFFIKKGRFDHYINFTLYTVHKTFGFIISLIGSIGSGKSSTQSALAHAYTLKFQQDIQELHLKTRKIFKSIDFNLIDDYLISLYNQVPKEDLKFNLVTASLLHTFNISEAIHFDFLQHKTVFDYFKDYAFSFYVLYVRNNYVYSVTTIYSRMTSNFNMKYLIEWQRIHEAYQKNDYSIHDYAVELIDEATDELSASRWREEDKDESGAKEYRRKYRHIHQERNRIIDTRQDGTDLIKRYRTLTNTHLDLQSTELVFSYEFLFNMIKNSYVLKVFFYKFFTRWLPYFTKVLIPYIFKRLITLFIWNPDKIDYQQLYDFKYSSINYLRNLDNRLLHIQWFFKYNSLVKIESFKVKNSEDVGKNNPDTALTLFFKASWCFGTYKQFAFVGIQEQLLENSITNNMEDNVFFQPDFFDKTISDNSKGVVIDVQI